MTGLSPRRSDVGAATRGVGLTSLWTAASRAVESERRDALFHDPLARALAGHEGFAVLDAARAIVGDAEAVALRTKVFDERLMGARPRQVVLLGAGMDARAFRLPWLPATTVFEVDKPEVLKLKATRLGGAHPSCRRVEVPMSLTAGWPRMLVGRGFRPSVPTTWVAEGLLVYLERPVVHVLLRHVDQLSASDSVLLCDVVSDKASGSAPC